MIPFDQHTHTSRPPAHFHPSLSTTSTGARPSYLNTPHHSYSGRHGVCSKTTVREHSRKLCKYTVHDNLMNSDLDIQLTSGIVTPLHGRACSIITFYCCYK